MEYYFNVDGKPIYLSESKATKEVGSSTVKEASEAGPILTEQDFIIEHVISNGTDPLKDYLKTSVSMNALIQMEQREGVQLCLGVKKESEQQFYRCILLRLEKKDTLEELKKDISEINKDLTVSSLDKDRLRVKECQRDKISPLFEMTMFNSFAQNLARAKEIMAKISDIHPEAQSLLEILGEEIPMALDLDDMKSKMIKPFIVLEGLDATGKTTLTKAFDKQTNAVRIFHPPRCIQPLRSFFDSMPEIIRRAYYALGNYITSVTIARECQSRPVISDRFWQSTVVYTVANEATDADVPPEGHDIYRWPGDLLKPEMWILLTISEDMRTQRIGGRDEMTQEERELQTNKSFRERLFTAYRRIRDPPRIEVDASGTPAEVFDRVYSLLRDKNLDIEMGGSSE